MKVRYMSDIHFEFMDVDYTTAAFFEKILPELSTDSETILVLAGDMCTLKKFDAFKLFLELVCDRFRKVLYVYGNHEYYHSNYDTIQDSVEFHGYDNLLIMNDDTIIIDNVKFIGTTLWSDCDKKNPTSITRIGGGMNDFYVIAKGEYGLFSVNEMLIKFDEHIEFIKREIDNCPDDFKIVVITHHAPSFKSVDEQFVGSELNGGFGSDLSELMLDYNPDYWIHGHMHNSSEYTIGQTTVVANPRGYPHLFNSFPDNFECENKSYDGKALFTL